jgi:hypothetical protein
VVADRQAGLPTTDDDGLHVLFRYGSHVTHPCRGLRGKLTVCPGSRR